VFCAHPEGADVTLNVLHLNPAAQHLPHRGVSEMEMPRQRLVPGPPEAHPISRLERPDIHSAPPHWWDSRGGTGMRDLLIE
jgi:hypothetical protein